MNDQAAQVGNPNRTDVQMVNGRVVNKPVSNAQPLPEVPSSDLLQSDKWGESWKKQAGEPDNAINALADAQANISRSFKTFMEMRSNQSPHQTQAQHLDMLAKDYKTTVNRAAGQTDRAVERAKARLGEIESQFKQTIGWNDRDAQELRSVVRSMSDNDRAEFIGSAIQNGDGQALAAILGGHPSLSGITADMQAAHRSRAMQLHAPKLLSLERTINKAVESTREAFLQMLDREEAVTASKLREKYAAQARAAAEARQRAIGDDGRWG